MTPFTQQPFTQQTSILNPFTQQPFTQQTTVYDVIDFTFPGWHKPCDDMTAVSKASLNKSGEAVLEFLRTRR